MSVASLNSTNPFSYLQSILQQGADASGVSDPLASLFAAFTADGTANPPATAGATTPTNGGVTSPFSPATLSALIALQGQQSSPGTDPSLASVFAKFDTDGNGQISQSEFESAIGANADTGKVDALFKKIDGNGDGAISQSEFAAAAQKAHGHHHHMHGGLADILSSTDATGATTKTTNNGDGSTTTTITYTDGTSIAMTTPPASSGSAAGGTSAGQGQTDATSSNDSSSGNQNLLAQLVQLQAEWLAQSAANTMGLSI